MKYAALAGKGAFEMREGSLKVKDNPLIKVCHVGVCGTDFAIWKTGDDDPGVVMGHEYTGIIEEPGTSGLFKKGDRVAGYTQNVYNEGCGHCEKCLTQGVDACENRKVRKWKGGELEHPGAYSEYTTWFPRSVYKLADHVAMDEATLIEPFAVSLHAMTLSNMQPGDKVLVLGGGIIGLAVCEWAQIFGAGQVAITEINPEKMRIIEDFGIATNVVNGGAADAVERLIDVSDGGFDVVIDCVGIAPVINTGIAALKKEFMKTFVALGLPHGNQAINYSELVLRQTIFRGSKGHNYQEFTTVARAVENGRLKLGKYISKRIPFADIQRGFEEIDASQGLVVKAIVDMN